MNKIIKILSITIIVISILTIGLLLHINYNLNKTIAKKDAVIKQDSIDYDNCSNWANSYFERMNYAETELEKYQDKDK